MATGITGQLYAKNSEGIYEPIIGLTFFNITENGTANDLYSQLSKTRNATINLRNTEVYLEEYDVNL